MQSTAYVAMMFDSRIVQKMWFSRDDLNTEKLKLIEEDVISQLVDIDNDDLIFTCLEDGKDIFLGLHDAALAKVEIQNFNHLEVGQSGKLHYSSTSPWLQRDENDQERYKTAICDDDHFAITNVDAGSACSCDDTSCYKNSKFSVVLDMYPDEPNHCSQMLLCLEGCRDISAGILMASSTTNDLDDHHLPL